MDVCVQILPLIVPLIYCATPEACFEKDGKQLCRPRTEFSYCQTYVAPAEYKCVKADGSGVYFYTDEKGK